MLIVKTRIDEIIHSLFLSLSTHIFFNLVKVLNLSLSPRIFFKLGEGIKPTFIYISN